MLADNRVFRTYEITAVIIDESKQQETSNPSEGRFPAKPMQGRRHHLRAFLFLNQIESAAMDHPDEFFGVLAFRGLLLQLDETSIEPGEIISRAHPHDACEHVGP